MGSKRIMAFHQLKNGLICEGECCKLTDMWFYIEKFERGWLTYKFNMLCTPSITILFRDGTSTGLYVTIISCACLAAYKSITTKLTFRHIGISDIKKCHYNFSVIIVGFYFKLYYKVI